MIDLFALMLVSALLDLIQHVTGVAREHHACRLAIICRHDSRLAAIHILLGAEYHSNIYIPFTLPRGNDCSKTTILEFMGNITITEMVNVERLKVHLGVNRIKNILHHASSETITTNHVRELTANADARPLIPTITNPHVEDITIDVLPEERHYLFPFT
jgi:hypothetical protein